MFKLPRIYRRSRAVAGRCRHCRVTVIAQLGAHERMCAWNSATHEGFHFNELHVAGRHTDCETCWEQCFCRPDIKDVCVSHGGHGGKVFQLNGKR